MYEIVPLPGRAPRLIDAGANVGLAALFWRHRYRAFEYVGFEPDPQLADVARQNLRAWGCEGTLHQVAVAAGSGETAFVPDGADGGRLAAGGGIQVQTVDLAEYLHEPVDLLKIDIEGAEHDVLAAMDSKLEMVRNLFVEMHSSAGEPSRWGATVALLERAGFTCYAQPVRAPWLPFLEAPALDAGYSDQFNVFAVRSRS